MKPLTVDDLYALGMGSEIGYRIMPKLCAALGVDYPPQRGDMTVIAGKTAVTLLIESHEGELA